MRISLEVPSNDIVMLARMSESFYLHMPDSCEVSVIFQGVDDLDGGEERVTRLFPERAHITFLPQEDIPPLFHYRCRMMREAKERGVDAHLLGDSDFVFKEHSFQYYSECVETSRRLKEETGRSAIVSCAATFGAFEKGFDLSVAERGTFATEKGIVVDSELGFNDYSGREIRGGFEDQLISLLFVVEGGAIPLRRFLCPTHARPRTRKSLKRGFSPIHAVSIWSEYSWPLVREVCEDPFWRIYDFPSDPDCVQTAIRAFKRDARIRGALEEVNQDFGPFWAPMKTFKTGEERRGASGLERESLPTPLHSGTKSR